MAVVADAEPLPDVGVQPVADESDGAIAKGNVQSGRVGGPENLARRGFTGSVEIGGRKNSRSVKANRREQFIDGPPDGQSVSNLMSI